MEIKIDFDIFPTENIKTLGISDTSHYHLSTITNSKLTIVIPGYKLPIIVKFKPNRINILNSNNLGLSQVSTVEELGNLPDGIYQIKYTGNIGSKEYSVEKSFFRIEAIKDRFEKAILKLDVNSCDTNTLNSRINDLAQIQIFLYSAMANGNTCNFAKAIEQYQIANKKLDKILNC